MAVATPRRGGASRGGAMRQAVRCQAGRQRLQELTRRQGYIKRVREDAEEFWTVRGACGRLVALAPSRDLARAAAGHFGLEPVDAH